MAVPSINFMTVGTRIADGIGIIFLCCLAISAALLSLTADLSAGELHKAARSGDLDLIAALLRSGADVDETDGEGQTALHEAAKADQAEAVAALLAAGADPLISGKGPFGTTGTPLHAAAREGRLGSLRVLLEAGIDPNLADAGAGPPLHLAVFYHQQEAVELLKSYGARRMEAHPIDDLVVAADAADGALIAGTCRACHALDANTAGKRFIGPSLWNLVGRSKAALETYAYSEALKQAGGIWDYRDLNSFLSDPRGFIPGTRMLALDGIEGPERRASLIRYLRSLADTPVALPQ